MHHIPDLYNFHPKHWTVSFSFLFFFSKFRSMNEMFLHLREMMQLATMVSWPVNVMEVGLRPEQGKEIYWFIHSSPDTQFSYLEAVFSHIKSSGLVHAEFFPGDIIYVIIPCIVVLS